jgi:3-methyladenine DNA glycosylase AlkD
MKTAAATLDDTDSAVEAVLDEMRALGRADRRAGMARYGINTDTAFGVKIPELRAIAKRLGRHQDLSLALWQTGYHEARILAAMVGEPARVDPDQMDAWTAAFNSWDLCDQVLMNLFEKTEWRWTKAVAWAGRNEEFVKRAGYALMARLAVSDKRAEDDRFVALLPLIERAADDPRNFVKKAVNWALRQIGKRNRRLHPQALACAKRIAQHETTPARWIARDAIRELTDPKTLSRIKP